MKQGDLQAILKRRHLTADGGLAQVQRFARLGKALRLRDGIENAEFIPIHMTPNDA
jgi:hypothetical protein